MPVHNGHLLVCDIASALVDELTVLVCSRDCEPIDGELRFAWLRDLVNDDVNVVHLHQEIPQQPSENDDFWNIWRTTIKQLIPNPIDWVFGSEEYVPRLAKELNAKPLIIDQPRQMMPVSATKIRHNPRQYWQHIPSVVRPYYQKRVCLLGAESAGKSQLTEALSQQFSTLAVPEYGRFYDQISKQGKNWCSDDFLLIAQGHVSLQQQIACRAGYLYFEDTDLLQTIVWAEYLLGEVPDVLKNRLKKWQPANFYLLLSDEVPWINDGSRYCVDAKDRNWFFKKLKSLLTQFKLPYETITGSKWNAREKSAQQAVQKFLN